MSDFEPINFGAKKLKNTFENLLQLEIKAITSIIF
jgi:hypothetical protein